MDHYFYINCNREEETIPIENRKTQYVRKQQFDEGSYNLVLQSASEWFVAIVQEITYDRFYYPGHSNVDIKINSRKLFDDEILTENNVFAGAVLGIGGTRESSYDMPYYNNYGIMPAHIAEIKSGETVLIGIEKAVPMSSDYDAYKDTYYFLCKKEMSKIELNEGIIGYSDLLWFGTDNEGYIFCARSMESAVPTFVSSDREKNSRISMLLLRQDLIGRNRLHDNPHLLSLITQRGFYYFEADVDDLSGKKYTKIASPTDPVRLDDLPAMIREYLDDQRLLISIRDCDSFTV